MTANLYLFQALTQLFYFLSLGFSIRALYERNLPKRLQRFFWYPLVGVTLIVFFWLDVLKITPPSLFPILNKLSLIFHYTFLSFFICATIDEQRKLGKRKLMFWTLNAIVIAFVISDVVNKTIVAYSIANLFLFILCIMFYYRLFEQKPYGKLVNDPSFWIVTGIFLGMGITIPAYIFSEYLFTSLKPYYYQLIISVGVGYSIMHIFFIKALTIKTDKNV